MAIPKMQGAGKDVRNFLNWATTRRSHISFMILPWLQLTLGRCEIICKKTCLCLI